MILPLKDTDFTKYYTEIENKCQLEKFRMAQRFQCLLSPGAKGFWALFGREASLGCIAFGGHVRRLCEGKVMESLRHAKADRGLKPACTRRQYHCPTASVVFRRYYRVALAEEEIVRKVFRH